MEQGYVIEVKDVTKKFKVYYDKGSQLKERLLFRSRNRYEERWVLNGISFKVKQGEAIGLVGHNGCGKSTTLKLLTKIIYPDSGTIEMKGRVSSLLELGAGFHPDMSGRENIYTNASIFGLTKKEIDERMEDIIAFSELEEFLDNPVRTYSSGMYMRLAFSVAINVDADILLIDEILAVGDANFQAKCFDKLMEIKKQGTTIVIVSHALNQIEQICDRSIWIQDGKILAEGSPRDVHPQYLEFMGALRQEVADKEKGRQEAKEKVQESEKERKRWGNRFAEITEVTLKNESGEPQSVFSTGESFWIELKYTVHQTVEDAVFGFGIFRNDGVQCYGTNTRIDQTPEFDLTESGSARYHLEHINFLPGKYLIDVTIELGDGIPVDYYREVATLEVYSVVRDAGVARIPHQWEFLGNTWEGKEDSGNDRDNAAN
ncbi:ABC transporter ATP-binding protein [Cuneatibacter sp. NSJ-177]|uniref:ABC transporter ATP-binding protein n=1 Tax=Cuneatibacter sp. NSJ-177 TaxID=2931401 RepID=UPI001FD4D6C7|nr:ABC transporter ATP-binding protein [Cuneatibacter sp. NSJ-177]MCJ7833776.1 ABC transporter ATP-binding protein [Cuneatibacter sp. NSJ-177]